MTINFNADAVRKLAEILADTNLTEIEYEENGSRIYVARQPAPVTVHAAAPQNYTPAPAQEAHAAPHSIAEKAANKLDFHNHPGSVKSPLVGITYLSPSPEAAPFVKVGDSISVGQTLLIVEAMKVMNPIKATKAGTLTHILVSNTAPVEYDQPLMVIE